MTRRMGQPTEERAASKAPRSETSSARSRETHSVSNVGYGMLPGDGDPETRCFRPALSVGFASGGPAGHCLSQAKSRTTETVLRRGKAAGRDTAGADVTRSSL